jgi:hypothetical protein
MSSIAGAGSSLIPALMVSQVSRNNPNSGTPLAVDALPQITLGILMTMETLVEAISWFLSI